MTTYNYFTLEDTIGTIKRFRVIQSAYEPIKEKKGDIKTTIDGYIDASVGGIYDTFNFTIQIRETEEDSNYGTKADLEYFFVLNNPSGTPSNVLEMVDNYGNTYSVLLVGKFVPKPTGCVIEGSDAWYLIPLQIQVIPTEPTVANVSSSKTNGTYGIGETIPIQVYMSRPAFVTGTPQIELETGATDRKANYASGSGTNLLIFNYVVQAGDSSADLDYKATTSLTLNGGTILTNSGEEFVLTLATPGAAHSLAANKAIVINTTP